MRLTVACLAVAGIAVLTHTPVSHSAPIDGVFVQKIDVGPEGSIITKRFRGGERASVQVIGDHKSAAVVTVTVHDAKGNLIVEDKGRESSVGDMAAAIWYPPRDGDYRITIRHSAPRTGKYFMAIR